MFERYINPPSYNTRGRNNLMFPVDKLSSYERGYIYNVIRFTQICPSTQRLRIDSLLPH
ncbi:hypothetical protein O3M35_011193 [Rhynocoris fuscipes]|uniref:Uncharacterized protein n=1 Tax=Rhynocoris fuscipes TaxID=488301 RepID=A0AAW1CVC1_9HEMI